LIFEDKDVKIEEIRKEDDIAQKEFFIHPGDSFIEQPIKLKISKFIKPAGFEPLDNRNIAFLNEHKLEFPLKIRKWEKGVFFYPLGLNKKKLLSDFFIDNKFTIPEKEKTWIITSGSQIVWIVGHRIDNRYKISDKTKNILQIEVVC